MAWEFDNCFLGGQREEIDLKVTDCDIDTAATSGIAIAATNALQAAAVGHNVTIEHCVITGLINKNDNEPDPINDGSGNFISVMLGGVVHMLEPIDMRSSVFEVTGECHLDPIFWTGVYAGHLESDSISKFTV